MHRNYGKHDHKAVHCPERNNEEKNDDTNANTLMQIQNAASGTSVFTVAKWAIGLVCITARKMQKKVKGAIDDKKEQENEQVELKVDSNH